MFVQGEPLALGGARQRAVLALLALRAGELVSRDRLIDDLWGDDAATKPANALAALVARLRKVLPRDVLLTHGSGYELHVDDEAIDLVRFERLFARAAASDPAVAGASLREALELWRGPALAEFAYESWAQPAIARLDELRLAAFEARIDADVSTGGGVELVGELEALIHEHPLRERLRGQLMLALYRAGRQADALEAYRQARSALVDELGIEPSRDLHELEQAILRQDPTLAPDRPAGAPARRVVLACALDPARADALLALAEPLVAGSDREVLLLVVASTDGLSDATGLAHDRARAAADRGVSIRAAAFTSPEPDEDVLKVLREHDVDLLLVDVPSGVFRERLQRCSTVRRVTSAFFSPAARPSISHLPAPCSFRSAEPSTSGRRSRSGPGSRERPVPRFAWPGLPRARQTGTRAGCWPLPRSSFSTRPGWPPSLSSSKRAPTGSSRRQKMPRSSFSASPTAGARRASARHGRPWHSEPGRLRSSCGVGFARVASRRAKP